MSSKKNCKGKTLDGKPCVAPPIKHSFNKDTGKKYNTDYCQMHQPDRISKSCKCPHCDYHRKIEIKQIKQTKPKSNLKERNNIIYEKTQLKLTSEQKQDLEKKKNKGKFNALLKLTSKQKRKLVNDF